MIRLIDFGAVDVGSGECERVTLCLGYLRGLAFHGGLVVAGLSQRSRAAESLAIDFASLGVLTYEIRRSITIGEANTLGVDPLCSRASK